MSEELKPCCDKLHHDWSVATLGAILHVRECAKGMNEGAFQAGVMQAIEEFQAYFQNQENQPAAISAVFSEVRDLAVQQMATELDVKEAEIARLKARAAHPWLEAILRDAAKDVEDDPDRHPLDEVEDFKITFGQLREIKALLSQPDKEG